MNDMTAEVGSPQASRVTVNVIGTEHLPEPLQGAGSAGAPNGSFLYVSAVDELPSVDVVAVDLDLQLANSGKTERSALSEDSSDEVNGVLEHEIVLSESSTVERYESSGQICRNGNSSIGSELLVSVQAKPEVRTACILGILERDHAAVCRAAVFIDQHSRFRRIVYIICIRRSSQKEHGQQ